MGAGAEGVEIKVGDSSLLYTVILGFLVFVLVRVLWGENKKNKNQTPGPRPLPILGHLPLLGNEPYKTLLEWKKIYGPILSVKFGSFP